MKKIIFTFALLMVCWWGNAQVDVPKAYFQYEGNFVNTITSPLPGTCTSGNDILTPNDAVIPATPVAPQVGSYCHFISSSSASNAPVNSCLLSSTTSSSGFIAFEMLFRSDAASTLQDVLSLFRVLGSGERYAAGFEFSSDGNNSKPRLYFYTPTLTVNTPSGQNNLDAFQSFQIELTGEGKKTWDHYFNGQWHHIVFWYNAASGVKRVYVDGELPQGFEIAANNAWVAENAIGQSEANTLYLLNNNFNYRFLGDIDELAIYFGNIPLSSQQILQDYADINNQTHYTHTLSSSTLPQPNYNGSLNILDYAVGHTLGGGDHSSDVNTYDQVTQLKRFPEPRYKPGHNFRRNSNWMSPTYLGGYPGSGIPSTSVVSTALALQVEMATHWNYAFLLCENTSTLGDPLGDLLTAAFIGYANNSAVDLGWSINTYRAQLRFDCLFQQFGQTEPYIKTQMMNQIFSSYEHYLRNGLNHIDNFGNIVNPDFVECESPNDNNTAVFAPKLSLVQHYDGDATSQVNRLLNIKNGNINGIPPLNTSIKIQLVGENNEISPVFEDYDTSPPFAGSVGLDNSVLSEISFGIDRFDYLGDIKRKIDNRYTNVNNQSGYPGFLTSSLVSSLFNSSTILLNYAVDGLPRYRYNYEQLRETQSQINGMRYSTPDFYPRVPSTWHKRSFSADHGFKWMSNCRNHELMFGDIRYAPFVAAGWDYNEENNIRPAQWLALLKAIGLMGVDFYQTGFFDERVSPVTNLPAVPKGYVWQAASPSYAQATLTRLQPFFDSGDLMAGDMIDHTFDNYFSAQNNSSQYNYNGYAFRFNGGSPSKLIVARQLKSGSTLLHQYAITTSLQPSSNISGNVLNSDIVSFNLDPSLGINGIKINANRQGSTYIFDYTNTANPIFYQVDSWHENTHPDHWTKDFDLEAKVFDNTTNTPTIATIDNTTNAPVVLNGNSVLDFTNSTSFVSFANAGQSVEYNFQPRADGVANTYNFYMRARSLSAAGSSCKIELVDANGVVMQTSNIKCVSIGAWQWYKKDACPPYNDIAFNNLADDAGYKVIVTSSDASLQIDRIYLDAATPETFFTPLSSGCAYTVTFNNGSNLNSQTVPAGSLVAVNGTVVCNSTLTFTNCTFAMSGSAAVNVNAGGNLTFNNCTFYSVCNSMWNGITNNGGVVTMTGCNVQDALGSLETTNGSQVTVTGNMFDHNYSALRFIGGSYTNSTVYGNTFTNTGAQLTKTPRAGQDPPYHVYAENVTLLNIGKVGFAQKQFYNAQRGIFCNVSNVNVYNNHFENIGDNNYQMRIAAGNVTPVASRNLFAAVCAGGTRANEVTLNVGNGTAAATNTFFNCQAGVFTQFKVNTWVDLNTFDQCTQGIAAYSVDAPYVVIRNNTINRFSEGVTLYQVVNNPWVNVINNQFNTGIGYDPSYYGTAAINIRNYSLQSGSYYTVTGNTMGNTEKGIHLENLAAYIGGPGGYAGLLIKANTINQVIPNSDLTSFHYGIWTENCVGVNIIANNVLRSTNGSDPNFISLAPQQDLLRGISIDQTSRSTIKDNRTQNMGTDIRVLGSCIGANIRCNRMQSSFQGIKFLSATITTTPQYGSPTDPTDNSWENSYLSNTNDRATGSFANNQPLDWYHRNDLSGNGVAPQNLYCPYYPLAANPITPQGNANGAWNCNHIQNLTDDDKDEMLRIAQNQVTYDEFAQENQFYNKEFTFNNLDDNPALMNSGSQQDAWLQQFYNAEKTGNTGKIKDVKDYIAIKDKQQAQLKNLSIVDNTLLLQNLKLANSIYLTNYFEVDTPTVDSLTLLQLQNLAYQNAIQGGEGVYMARAMLNLDVEDAVNVMRMAQAMQNKKDNDAFNCKVYPNPSTGVLYVSYLLEINQTGNFILTDATGRNLKDISLNQNSNLLKIDLSAFEGGVYYYQFNNGNSKQSGKIVIVK